MFTYARFFMTSHVHATSPPCSRAVAQARPRMSCIRLVYIYCHSLGNWIGLSAPGLQFIQASYTADTWSGRAARVLTISDHVMYNFRTSTWVNLVTPEVTRGDSNRSLKNYGFLYDAIFSSRVCMRTNHLAMKCNYYARLLN